MLANSSGPPTRLGHLQHVMHQRNGPVCEALGNVEVNGSRQSGSLGLEAGDGRCPHFRDFLVDFRPGLVGGLSFFVGRLQVVTDGSYNLMEHPSGYKANSALRRPKSQDALGPVRA